jgi:hypothetical protein
LSDPT